MKKIPWIDFWTLGKVVLSKITLYILDLPPNQDAIVANKVLVQDSLLKMYKHVFDCICSGGDNCILGGWGRSKGNSLKYFPSFHAD